MKRTFVTNEAIDCIDEDFPMRVGVRGLSLDGSRPALENLSGRKPRGLVAAYGESGTAWLAALSERWIGGLQWTAFLRPLRGIFG